MSPILSHLIETSEWVDGGKIAMTYCSSVGDKIGDLLIKIERTMDGTEA